MKNLSSLAWRAGLVGVALSVGCYSTSLLQEPEVLEPGKLRVTAGLAADFDKAQGENLPSPELAARVGVFTTTELRVKGSVSGVELGANVRVYEDERLRLLVMPQYREYWNITEDRDGWFDETLEQDVADIRALAVPVVAALRSPSRVEPFVGFAPHAGRSDEKGFAATAFHLGVSLPLGEHLSVIPECSLLVSVVGPKRSVRNDDDELVRPVLRRGDAMAQCGMGLSFGSAYP